MASNWIEQLFSARQVSDGGVVRRSINDVETYSSLQEIINEARQREFHVIATGDQVVVLCHQGGITIHC